MKEMTYIVKEMHPLPKEQRRVKISLKALKIIEKETELMTYEKSSGNLSQAIR